MHKAILNSMTEKELQAMLLEAARLTGWLTFHDYDSRKNARGFLDTVLCHPQGDFFIVECKTEKGRIRPEQQQWLDALQAAGVEARIVRPHDWDDLIERLQRRRIT